MYWVVRCWLVNKYRWLMWLARGKSNRWPPYDLRIAFFLMERRWRKRRPYREGV
jgi:hypothetical protein